MIQVYIREIRDVEGQLLGEFEPVHLPQLIHSFTEYPTYLEDAGDVVAKGNNVSGQYVHSVSKGVYFEIIIELEAPEKAG